MVARKLKKTSKVKVSFSRRKSTGFSAGPQNSFRDFNDYCRTDLDKKECSSKIKSYIKLSMNKSDAQIALQAPEWAFTSIPFVAATIVWKEMNKEFPVWWKADVCIEKHLNEILQRGSNNIERKANSDEETGLVKKSIQEIVKEKTSEFIANVDEIIDAYDYRNHDDHIKYSIYNELKKIDAPYNMAKTTNEYYIPQRDEISELINNKTPDLVEAYSNWSISRRKKYLQFLTQICTDIEKYMASKKAMRATRKPKVKTADKQVEKMQFLKESAEYKLTSISPTSVIGAMRIYTFNTKYKRLTEYVCEKSIGFEIKGTTLQGIDKVLSRSISLRKPDAFIPIVLNKSSTQINKEWSNLTTKTVKDTNGRINKDTIVLRAMAK